MSDETTRFGGGIPENYDRGLGPIFFADYADHTARLVAGYAPLRVLETGAGTGIVTRRLRDLLPATTRLVATDLNPPMLENRATKSLPRCRDSNRLLRATRPSWFSARRFVPPGLPCGDRSDCGRLRRMRDRTGGYWLHLSGGLIIFAIGVTDRTRTCDSQLRGQSL